MSVTIELEPEIERRLSRKAAENGLKIETYIKVLIEEKVNDSSEKAAESKQNFSEAATTEEWLDEFHKWVDSHRDKNYPHLSDDALRRENIY